MGAIGNWTARGYLEIGKNAEPSFTKGKERFTDEQRRKSKSYVWDDDAWFERHAGSARAGD